MTRREQIAESYPEVLFADGFDGAITGVVERCAQEPFVVYDAERCIEILMEDDAMTREQAIEHFEFNVTGAWVGAATPGFLWRPVPDDEEGA